MLRRCVSQFGLVKNAHVSQYRYNEIEMLGRHFVGHSNIFVLDVLSIISQICLSQYGCMPTIRDHECFPSCIDCFFMLMRYSSRSFGKLVTSDYE